MKKDERITILVKSLGWKNIAKTKDKCPHCSLPIWKLDNISVCEDLLRKEEINNARSC